MKNQVKIRKLEFARENITEPRDQKLLVIHDRLFPTRGSRMKIAELGDMFPKNSIICQSYYCKNYEKIQEEYEYIEEMHEKLKSAHEQALALGKIIRARQRVEMYKVPIFIDLAEEAIDNGYSLAIFVNYLDTMHALVHHLDIQCMVHGGQSIEERELNIANFQSNKHKIIICIMQAGGVGISLHDIHGGHQRMSLISPTWSGQDIKQALGRIHRAGSQTPAIQKIVYCAETYEERLLDIINKKIKNIDAINDRDLIEDKYDSLALEELDGIESAMGDGEKLDDIMEEKEKKEHKKDKKKKKSSESDDSENDNQEKRRKKRKEKRRKKKEKKDKNKKDKRKEIKKRVFVKKVAKKKNKDPKAKKDPLDNIMTAVAPCSPECAQGRGPCHENPDGPALCMRERKKKDNATE